jgi:2,3,4,5-tetrahydropyridine-2-carboxylate N-succinyltransferase
MSNLKVKNEKEFKVQIGQTQAQKGYRLVSANIVKVQKGQVDTDATISVDIPAFNWNDNLGSGAVFIDALTSTGVNVDFTQTEQVEVITPAFIDACMDSFNPYIKKAIGKEHKNVQVIKKLNNFFDPDTAENLKYLSDKLDRVKIFNDIKNGLYKVVLIFEDAIPQSVESVYVKLHALSTGKSVLRETNLNGAFGILPNLAWSGRKAYELDYLRENEIDLKFDDKYPNIDMVDKFPRFLQHVIPADNTRILDTSKVRFGAQLAAGTIVMPGASYINFNAGTLGPVMVEGRISSSAIVGAGSDVGGGASILGVLSGTDGNPISIGENTLLSANSVTGIPLGDACIVDGGLAIFAGTKIEISSFELDKILKDNPDSNFDKEKLSIYKNCNTNGIGEYGFKAAALEGLNGIHFRQDSQTGVYIAMRSTREVKLNAELH